MQMLNTYIYKIMAKYRFIKILQDTYTLIKKLKLYLNYLMNKIKIHALRFRISLISINVINLKENRTQLQLYHRNICKPFERMIILQHVV